MGNSKAPGTGRARRAAAVAREWLSGTAAAEAPLPEPSAPTYRLVSEQPPKPREQRIGVCLSGGGLRSASFNLGVLQMLRKKNVLEHADYLTAVSGGAYIAASLETVTAKSDQKLFDECAPFAEGSPELRHLRANSKYLANGPRLKSRLVLALTYGIGSAVVLLGAWLFLFARPLGWAYAEFVAPELQRCEELERILPTAAQRDVNPTRPLSCDELSDLYTDLGRRREDLRTQINRQEASLEDASRAERKSIRAEIEKLGVKLDAAEVRTLELDSGDREWRLFSVLALFGVALGLATAERVVAGTRASVLAFLRVWASRFLVAAVIAAVLLVVLPEVLVWIRNVTRWRARGASSNPIVKSADAILGGLGLGRPKQIDGVGTASPVGIAAATAFSIVGIVARWLWKGRATRSRLISLAAYALAPLLVLGIGLKFTNDAAADGWTATVFCWWLVISVVGIGLVLPALYRVNRSSLHDLYRERLSSAFILKRFSAAQAEPVPYDEALPVSSVRPPSLPQLVVCAAANVTDPGTTPTGMGAVPFIFSSDQSGIPATVVGAAATGGEVSGLLPATSYEALATYDTTLPAVMAMTGAAFSPLMGRQTKPAYRFLMALLNLRVGLWLPNPVRAKEMDWTTEVTGPLSRYARRWREPGVKYLLYEAIGRSSLRDRYVYVSDGGHYDNLGLIELLRRRCTTIYCSDASGAPAGSLATLAESIELAATELGITIDGTRLEASLGYDPPTEENAKLAGSATITYPDGAKGKLIYITLGMTADVPLEVRSYFEASRRDATVGSATPHHFPWDPTSDQLFDHRKLEAYRVLGNHAAGQAFPRRA